MALISPVYPEGATLAIIQAHPDRMDIQGGQPNESASGRFLKKALYEVGIKPSAVIFDYLTTTYPGLRGLDGIEARDMVRRERPRLIDRLSKAKPKCIILMGDAVKTEWGIIDKFSNVRGFVFTVLEGLQIPHIVTFNPMSIFRGMLQHEVTLMNDLHKAVQIAEHGLKRDPEHFILQPTIHDIRRWERQCIKHKPRLYPDIESVGHLSNRDQNQITMIGIGRGDTKEVLVIPVKTPAGDYWPADQWDEVRRLVKSILTTCECVFHNGEFDVKHLNFQGFGPVRIGGDTLLLHHALHAELPHDLGYVASIFCNIPYWKGTLKNAKSQMDIDPLKFRRYNAYDCLSMMQMEDKLIEENKEQGTYEVYKDISIPLLNEVMHMNHIGMPVDREKLATWKTQLRTLTDKLLLDLGKTWPIHLGFNWHSPQQLIYLFYGEKPATFDTKLTKYQKYFKEGCKLKRNTKVFKDLEEYVKVYQETKPLPKMSKVSVKRGKSGPATDDEMRLRIKKAMINRLAEIHNLKRPQERHHEEAKELDSAITVLETLNTYAENEKLLSTYTKLHIEPDGRVHFGFKVHGTRTGRLSSYGPNGQNIPYEAKKIFVDPAGRKFVQFDYSNLELVVLGQIAGVQHYIRVFKQGLNVHSENTKHFLGIDETHPNWDKWRRAMKMYVFGRNYGGGLPGMYRRMLTEIKGFRMTMKELEKLDRDYFDLLPEYKVWYAETEKQLRETRTLHNAFGRSRIFLGEIEGAVRSGLNFPIQGTAADIMSMGIIKFGKEIRAAKAKRPDIQTEPMLTVHDSLVLLVPPNELLMVAKMLKRTMCAPLPIGGTMVPFNGELKIGDDYQKGEEMKLDDWITRLTNERDERRKQRVESYGKE